MAVSIKTEDDIKYMREAGIIAAQTLKVVQENAEPGISGYELDCIAEKFIRKNKSKPAFKGYNGFPCSICISLNNEIVHGIPDKRKILKNADLVSVDAGVYKNGFYSDTAVTFVTGKISKTDYLKKRLIEVTRLALNEAIKRAVKNGNIYDISFTVQSIAESAGYGVVREYTGHGIGKKLHEKPKVLNYVPNFQIRKFGIKLKKGFVIAIEPMLTIGSYKTVVADDGWTVLTKDGSLSSHFEHTVAVTDEKPFILTKI